MKRDPQPPPDGAILVQAVGIGKTFGAVRALRDVSLDLWRGETVGIVGHNGAGKSTLVNILGGTLAPDSGELQVAGTRVTAHWDVRAAQHLGVRRVFQELSLCPNLTLAENMHLAQPVTRGIRWRRGAGAMLMDTLDRIFPNHGLHPDQVVADLPIGQKQAVEIARAFTPGREALELMILDEPTSSLDGRASDQLLAFIRDFAGSGKTCVLITHKLREIFQITDRVVVMRDGQVVDTAPTAQSDRQRLVAAMGQDEQVAAAQGERGGRQATAAGPSTQFGAAGGAPASGDSHGTSGGGPTEPAGPGPVEGAAAADELVHARVCTDPRRALQVRRGEVIGLAGLAGHGQTELLVRLRDAFERRTDSALQVHGSVAFVAGDRQADGVFPLWSIERNMSLGSLAPLHRRGLIDLAAERRAVLDWRARLGLVTPDVGLGILTLSGGNQQKVMFARALASSAQIILMDDPMRGVDIGTKHDVYALIAAEARSGRSFIWYTTEFDELYHCDRVYVFRNARVVGEVSRADLSEEHVLGLSFDDAA
jgi:ribose transport system ATP-binding protein